MVHVRHLTELERRRAGGHIEADSLRTQGFVHASPDEPAMLAVATTLYSDPTEPLVVLVVDTEVVGCEVRWEAAEPGPPPGVEDEVLFPHVFGPIPRAAVAGVLWLTRGPRGNYIVLEEIHHSAD